MALADAVSRVMSQSEQHTGMMAETQNAQDWPTHCDRRPVGILSVLKALELSPAQPPDLGSEGMATDAMAVVIVAENLESHYSGLQINVRQTVCLPMSQL